MIAIENMMKRNRIALENKQKLQINSASEIFALELNEKHKSRRSENEIGEKKKTKKLNDKGIERIQSIISEGEIKQKEIPFPLFCEKEGKKCKEKGKTIEEIKELEEISGRVRNKQVLKENNDNYCNNFKKELNINEVLQKVEYNKTKTKKPPNLNDKKEAEKRIEEGKGIGIDKQLGSKEIILKGNETSPGKQETTTKREIFGKIVKKFDKSRQIYSEEIIKKDEENTEIILKENETSPEKQETTTKREILRKIVKKRDKSKQIYSEEIIKKDEENTEIILKENETSPGKQEATNKREIFGKIVKKLDKSRRIFSEETKKEEENTDIILKENETSPGKQETTTKKEVFGKIVKKLDKSRQIFSEEIKKEEDTNNEEEEFQKMICEKNENNFAIVEEVENLGKMKDLDRNEEGSASIDGTNNFDRTDDNDIGITFENILQSPRRTTTQNERFIKFYIRSKLWLQSRPVFKSIFRSINDSNPSNLETHSGDFEENLQSACPGMEQETNEEQDKEGKSDEEQEREEGNYIFAKGKQKKLLGNTLFVGNYLKYEC